MSQLWYNGETILNIQDLAWAAGLFEGEGYFSVCMHKKSPALSAGLTSTDLDVLTKFQKIIGFGKIYTLSKQKPNHKQAWKWGVCSFRDFQAIGALLWKFLGNRRRNRFKEIMLFMLEKQKFSRGKNGIKMF